jgi:hypothetical protein
MSLYYLSIDIKLIYNKFINVIIFYINMSIKLPETPMDQIGMEPSLNKLIDWFKEVSEEMDLDEYIESNVREVLNEYKKDSGMEWTKGKYYLYGQVLTDPDSPITRELLQNAIDTNLRRYQEYGGPCNSFEAASIAHSKQLFLNLLELLGFYYITYNEISYAPGGAGYKRALKLWNDRIT